LLNKVNNSYTAQYPITSCKLLSSAFLWMQYSRWEIRIYTGTICQVS